MQISPETVLAVQHSQTLGNWIDSKMEVAIDWEGRNWLAATCFDIVHEHHKSIALLLEHNCYGSALTLLRPIYEAYVRGKWLLHCATEEDLQKFLKKDDIQRRLRKLVSEIQERDKHAGQMLEEIRAKHVATFSSFVHTGSWQILSRHTEQTIEPNYDERHITSLIILADGLALFAGLEIANLARNSELAKEFQEKIAARLA